MPKSIKTHVVYKGADNVIEQVVYNYDVATKVRSEMDWSSVTRITGSLVGTTIDFDESSLDGSENFDIGGGNGVIGFIFGSLTTVPDGTYPLRLQAYQGALDTVGTQIFHEVADDPSVPLVQFKFVEG